MEYSICHRLSLQEADSKTGTTMQEVTQGVLLEPTCRRERKKAQSSANPMMKLQVALKNCPKVG